AVPEPLAEARRLTFALAASNRTPDNRPGRPALTGTGRPLVRFPTTMTTPAVFADVQSPHLRALRNRIRLHRAPFSDRGSRILVWPSRKSDSAFDIKIAQRMTDIEPGVLDHLNRPPFIHGLRLVDETGAPLD